MLEFIGSAIKLLAIALMHISAMNGVILCLFLLKRLLFDTRFIETEPNSLSLETSAAGSDLQFCQIQLKYDEDDPSRVPLRELNSIDSMDINEEQTTIVEGMTFNIDRKEAIGYVGTTYSTLATIQGENNDIQNLNSISAGSSMNRSNNNNNTNCEGAQNSGRPRTIQRMQDTLHTNEQSSLIGKLIDLKRIQEVVWEANNFGNSIVQRVLASDPEWVSFISKFQASFWDFLEIATRLQGATQKKRQEMKTIMNPIHPNVLYYEKILIQTKSLDSVHGPQSKDSFRQFRILQRTDRREWPSAILLFVPRAEMNLRTVILAELKQFTQNIAIQWAKDIGSGVSFLNLTLGTAHRDLKPENILLFRRTNQMNTNQDGPNNELLSDYRVKIGDFGQALLVPTSCRVISAGSNVDILQISPPGISRNTANNIDAMHVDAYCFSMIILLMLIGYSDFQEHFMVRQFPYGILSMPRYRIDLFLNRFKQIPVTLKNVLTDVFKPRTRTTVSKIIRLEPFSVKILQTKSPYNE